MGGAQYQAKCMLDELIPSRKYDISYVARRIAPDFCPEGYRIVPIGHSFTSPRLGHLIEDAIPLYRRLREIQPDVIYQRVGCGHTAVAAYYARRHGARLIWHVAHDSDVIPAVANRRWDFRTMLEKKSVEYGLRNASHIICQTRFQANLLARNYGRKADAVIPNFHPSPTEAIDKTGPVSVLWVANLKRIKQPEIFVRLAARFQDMHSVRFIMVGGAAAGPRDGPWLERLMQSIVATPNLTFAGQRSQEEVNALLAQAHLLVNTSVMEGFSNTFIQAWMREVPVVSLNVNPDQVFDREDVGIHAGSEVDRLSDAVRSLVTDAARRSHCGAAARRYATSEHSVRNAQLIARLIDEPSGK